MCTDCIKTWGKSYEGVVQLLYLFGIVNRNKKETFSYFLCFANKPRGSYLTDMLQLIKAFSYGDMISIVFLLK